MKKILIIIFLFLLVSFGFLFFKHYNDEIPVIETMDDVVEINDMYIYGTSLNIKSSLDLSIYDDIKFVLYNGEFTLYDILYQDGVITFSDYINDGLLLDSIKRGNYFAFIRVNVKEDGKDNYKYYKLINKSNIEKLTYYTMSSINNRININFNNDYKTLGFDVSLNSNNDVYDITLDPGHGGMDGGAGNNGYYEASLTLSVANSVREYLEKDGYRVKLTREDGSLSNNKIMDEYGDSGRAVIPNLVHSKYTFSIHFNSNTSSKVSGLEIYTPVNINYDFINILASSITSLGKLNSSSNKLYKMFDSVYSRNFSDSDIENSRNKEISRGNTPYDISTNSNYYYMIRETGGKVTGAYVDDRNHDYIEGNPFVDSSIGNETYLLELGYLTNENDFDYIVNNTDELAKSIADGIINGLMG